MLHFITRIVSRMNKHAKFKIKSPLTYNYNINLYLEIEYEDSTVSGIQCVKRAMTKCPYK